MIKNKSRFDVTRRRAFARAKCQARFRYEEWELTWADWCDFWPTEEIWKTRGRSPESICLTRRDYELPWSRKNCCLLPRVNIATITNRRNTNLPTEHLWAEAQYLD